MARRSMVHRDSFNPPPLPNPGAAAAAAAAAASRWPSSVLLDKTAYLADRENATTATNTSRDGRTVKVSFCFAEPPAISYICVYCPDTDFDFVTEPHVVGAEGALVLIRLQFTTCYRREYFIYKANPGSSSLKRVQDPGPRDHHGRIFGVGEFGIVPYGNGGHFLLAALCFTDGPTDYELYIYSSEAGSWKTNPLSKACPGARAVLPGKVITLGQGLLGFVDLRHGMLLCNVLDDEHPVISYIPLPEPMPGNNDALNPSNCPVGRSRLFRDVTSSSNGVIKFIEMEHRVKKVSQVVPEKPNDPSDKDVLYDSDLVSQKDVHKKPKKPNKPSFVRDGWRAVTWNRTMSSNCWLKGCTVDVDDILVNNSACSLLSRVEGECIRRLTFKNLYSAFPTLSMNGGDLVYLRSSVNLRDRNGWVVAVDLVKKTLKVLAPYSLGRHNPFVQTYQPLTLSNHLNMTPGLVTAACCHITQTGWSENDPNNTEIRVGESYSCAAESKRPRLCAEKANCAQNGAKSVGPNFHLSRPHPVQNDQPPQQCFNRWDGASFYGYGQWYGGYYSPARNLYAYGTHPGYGNYQQPWQHLSASAGWHQPPPLLQPSASAAWQQPRPLPQQLPLHSSFGAHQ